MSRDPVHIREIQKRENEQKMLEKEAEKERKKREKENVTALREAKKLLDEQAEMDRVAALTPEQQKQEKEDKKQANALKKQEKLAADAKKSRGCQVRDCCKCGGSLNLNVHIF